MYVLCELYFNFTHPVTAGAASSYYTRINLCVALKLIQRIRDFYGSHVLSDIDNCGLLSKILFDLQVPTDSSHEKYIILAVTRNDLTV